MGVFSAGENLLGSNIEKYKKFGSAQSLVAQIEFIDDSVLYIKDYLLIDKRRKYAYHWQKSNGDLISRWDNSPHHNYISTFPHHRHFPDRVEISKERSLEDVIQIIFVTIKEKSSGS